MVIMPPRIRRLALARERPPTFRTVQLPVQPGTPVAKHRDPSAEKIFTPSAATPSVGMVSGARRSPPFLPLSQLALTISHLERPSRRSSVPPLLRST